ncbi:MAG: glycosyltransferase family 2 protein [Actinomycetes bacterium]
MTGLGVSQRSRRAASLVVWHCPIPTLATTVGDLAAQDPNLDAVGVLFNEDPEGVQAEEFRRTFGALFAPGVLRVTSRPDNHGFAGGHNLLLADLFDADMDGVLVANPDLRLGTAAVRGLAEAQVPSRTLRGPVLLLATPGDLLPEGRTDSLGIRWTRTGRHLDVGHGRPGQRCPAAAWPVAGLSGACLYVPHEVYRTVVGVCGEFFDADFIAYREDAELGIRCAMLGVSSWVVPSVQVLHARSQRGTARSASAFVNALGVRNRFLIAAKYGRRRPGGIVVPFLRDLVVVTGVLLVERASIPGLVDAWRLRHRMRQKGRLVRRACIRVDGGGERTIAPQPGSTSPCGLIGRS